MVDGTSGSSLAEEVRDTREPQRYGTVVVVGGGCYGSYYVRQLRRAAQNGALGYERLLVVDRDPSCRVAREVLAADALVAECGARGPAEVLVATVSHSNGTLSLQAIGD